MMCRGISALAIAAAALWRKRRQSPVPRTSSARTAAVMASGIVLLALGATHLGHYLERARSNERSLLAEIMAQPICTGSRAGPANIALAEPVSQQ